VYCGVANHGAARPQERSMHRVRNQSIWWLSFNGWGKISRMWALANCDHGREVVDHISRLLSVCHLCSYFSLQGVLWGKLYTSWGLILQTNASCSQPLGHEGGLGVVWVPLCPALSVCLLYTHTHTHTHTHEFFPLQ
jgi:hypothetical protein